MNTRGLRKAEIKSKRKNEIDATNSKEIAVNKITIKCKHFALTFHHSETLARKLKEKFNLKDRLK